MAHKKHSTGTPKSFWESLLRSNKDDIWRELSKQINSRIDEGGLFGTDKMLLDVRNWTITLDEYQVSQGKTRITYTRMRAPFKTRSDFRFCLTPHNLFSDISIKLFGAQDIRINDNAFDERFVIESNNERELRELLSSERLRNLVLSQGVSIQFALKDDEGWFGTKFPDGVNELYFSTPGAVRDMNVLQSMFEILTETLLKLEQMGIASAENPGVKF